MGITKGLLTKEMLGRETSKQDTHILPINVSGVK